MSEQKPVAKLPFARKKTVASVLSGFKKTVAELGQVAEAANAEVRRNQKVIQEANVAKEAANEEAGKALRIQAKISELLEL